jgi:RNase adaptor protein for sRNA GlmZ degradation
MKRIFWSGVGYAAGISTSIYVQKRVRRTVEKYAPEQMRHDVAIKSRVAAAKARDLVIDLREAAADGVDTMRLREQELRDEFAPDTGPDDPPHRHRPARLRH